MNWDTTIIWDLTAIVALTVALIEVVKDTFPKINRTWKQVTAWIFSLGFCYFIYFFETTPLFENADFYWPAIYGLAAGLISNGVYDTKDIAFIRFILDFIKSKFGIRN